MQTPSPQAVQFRKKTVLYLVFILRKGEGRLGRTISTMPDW